MKRVFLTTTILLLASRAYCAELMVPGQYPTIQAAIDAAQPGDTVIISPGIYTGEGNRNIWISGKAITVRSIDPNDPWVVDNTVIDCGWSGQGFYIDADVVLDGLTITHGNSISGGGIWILWASPLIRNCNIKNNNANRGGGIHCSYTGGSPTIIGCRISDNYATQYGGGIYFGALYCDDWENGCPGLTITDCDISDNMASGKGGGIYARAEEGGSLNISNCTILDNWANEGGGIYGDYRVDVRVNRSMIAGNYVTNDGGGAYVYGGSMELSDSVVVGNFSGEFGGGLFIDNDNPSVKAQRCTIAGNIAEWGGGGVSGYADSFNNCILWGNYSPWWGGGAYDQIDSPDASVILSCIQDDDPNDAGIPFGGEENGNIDDDPLFIWMPGDYGEFHLGPDSPCIDAGSPLYKGLGVTDIDGQPRVIGQALDMGADEYEKVIVVIKPKGGEVWATSSNHQIKWSGYGVGSVDILFSSDSGENWETIAAGITDANSYIWELPDDIESELCIISVLPGDGDPDVNSQASGLFTIRWYPVQPAVLPEWQHRGLLPAPDLSENKGPRLGCLKWVFDTNGPVSSQVAVTRPYWGSYGVYIGCEDGLIYALDDLGQFIWSRDINTPILGSPAVGYYWMVYVAGQNGKLYAIDDYGDVRWTHTTDAPVYATPVVGYSGKIYVCSEDGLVYALDADGSDLWTFQTRGPGKLEGAGAILATPVIEKNGAVYVAGLYDPNLYALDANSGSIKWVCRFASASDPNNTEGRHIFAQPTIGPDGTIYQTLVNDTNLYAIDPCTGSIIWATPLRPEPDYYCMSDDWGCCRIINQYFNAIRNHLEIPSWLLSQYRFCEEDFRWQGISLLMWGYYYPDSSGWSSPVVGPDGTIYVGLDDPYLRAVNPDGSIKWVTRLGVVGGFTLSIDRDGLIYAASDDGYVCVVDADGVEVSRFKGNNWVSFPAIADDGTLIVSDSNNRVWAISDEQCQPQQADLHRPEDMKLGLTVDFMDFALLANNWLACTDPENIDQYEQQLCGEWIEMYGLYPPADIDRDQYVDTWDLAELVDKWLMETSANWGDKSWLDWQHMHGPTVKKGVDPNF